MRHHFRNRRIINPLLATLAIASLTTSLRAADNWLAAADNWSNPANWSTGLPTTADTVNITNTDGTPRTITYDYTGPAVFLSQLNISLSNGTATASNTLFIPGNNLTSDVEIIGLEGSGTITHNSGTNSVNVDIELGAGAASIGAYNLSGNALLTGNAQLLVGSEGGGTGVFNQTGGAITLTNANGSLTGGNEDVGGSGSGTFIQTAGTNTITGDPQSIGLNVGGFTGGTTGSYTLSGTASLTVPHEGINPTGTFNQNGGTNIVNGAHTGILLQYNAPYKGAYNLNNGTTTAGALLNSGTFNQSGGHISVGEIVQHSQGTLNITGGTFSFEAVGVQSPGGSINGIFNIGDAGTLSLQIAGPKSAVDYDWLLIGGTASLGGTLNLDFANEFTPTVGEQFTLMNVGIPSGGTIGTITGAFNALTSDTPGLTYTVDYGPSHNVVIATITAVPEPAALSALIAAPLLLARRKTPVLRP